MSWHSAHDVLGCARASHVAPYFKEDVISVRTNPAERLFSGTEQPFGGLSNEEELMPLCPEQFLAENEWSAFANALLLKGGSTEGWSWKSGDEAVRAQQLQCFRGLLGSCIPYERKASIAGWMLSEMLKEVPKK